MKCPFCNSEDISVVRTVKLDFSVLRIRLCNACKTSFQTCEEIHLQTPINITLISSIKTDLAK